MSYVSGSSKADMQAKDNYRGQGLARAIAIQQGKLPPIRRAASAKVAAFVPVMDAAIKPNQEPRASKESDTAEKPHAPDLVYHAQVASSAFEAGLNFPDLEDIEAFEHPSGSGSAANPVERLATERQLEDARATRRNHLERLHNLNAWQFHTVVRDLIKQEDCETKDAARSRVMSGDRVIAMGRWSEKQRTYLSKLQLETSTKFTEHSLIRQLPLLTTSCPRATVPEPPAPTRPLTNAPAGSSLRHVSTPTQPAIPSSAASRPNPTRSMSSPQQQNPASQPPVTNLPLSSQRNPRAAGALPINRTEYDAMPEVERYKVARFLHSDRNMTHWLATWSEENNEALWAVYDPDHGFRSAVKGFVESKQSTDPRKR